VVGRPLAPALLAVDERSGDAGLETSSPRVAPIHPSGHVERKSNTCSTYAHRRERPAEQQAREGSSSTLDGADAADRVAMTYRARLRKNRTTATIKTITRIVHSMSAAPI
jgi:hypothetical protein